MRFILTLAVALFGFIGVAHADPFANFYNNTTVVTHPADGDRNVYIDEGGSYSMDLPDGSKASGHWEITGDQGCFTDDAAAPGDKPYCIPAVSHNIGESWEITAPDGTVEKATLVAGR